MLTDDRDGERTDEESSDTAGVLEIDDELSDLYSDNDDERVIDSLSRNKKK